MKPKIITVTGLSGSGKTTLIEKLIRHYRGEGMSVSVIKSTRETFEIEPAGKDTYRYRESGACATIITNGREFSLISKTGNDCGPVELAEKYFSDSDIVFIEGNKRGLTDKIEVIGESEEPPLYTGDPRIKILVSDSILDTDLPVCRRDDIEGIAAAIEKIFH